MPRVMPLRPDDRRHVGRYGLTGRFDDLAAGDDQPKVFLAKRTDGQTVVVSLLAENPAADAAARDRFTAEARAARRVPPFCTVRILDGGFDGACPYLVTEYVPGPSLAEVIETEGALPAGLVWALAAGTATGLTAIHQAGLVHGWLGPEKIILSPEGPRIFGFSITPPYGPATPAADMRAWARLVLAAALGRAPASPHDLASLPEGLRTVVTACLSPNPVGRPSAKDVLAELLRGQDTSSGMLAAGSRAAQQASRAAVPVTVSPGPGRQVPARQVPARQAPARRRRRRRWVAVWVAVGVACLAAIVAAGLAISGGGHPDGSRAATRTASPGHTALALPVRFAGNWSGTVHQTNPVLSTTVRISLTAGPTAGPTAGSVTYPDLGCSGTLSLTAAAPDKLTLAQKIQVGSRKCANGVITLASAAGGHVTFTFLRPGGQNPEGTLSKEH
jgi:eukaryotic-like serine/threonine-protein kinase